MGCRSELDCSSLAWSRLFLFNPYQRNNHLFQGDPAVRHRPLRRTDERRATGRNQREIVVRQPQRRPLNRLREPLFHLGPQRGVWKHADSLAAQIRRRALRGTTATPRLDVSVIGGQKDGEAVVDEQIEQRRKKTLARLLPNLVVHAGLSERHTMHDPVDRIDNQPDGTDPGVRHKRSDMLQVGMIAQILGVINRGCG